MNENCFSNFCEFRLISEGVASAPAVYSSVCSKTDFLICPTFAKQINLFRSWLIFVWTTRVAYAKRLEAIDISILVFYAVISDFSELNRHVFSFFFSCDRIII